MGRALYVNIHSQLPFYTHTSNNRNPTVGERRLPAAVAMRHSRRSKSKYGWVGGLEGLVFVCVSLVMLGGGEEG